MQISSLLNADLDSSLLNADLDSSLLNADLDSSLLNADLDSSLLNADHNGVMYLVSLLLQCILYTRSKELSSTVCDWSGLHILYL